MYINFKVYLLVIVCFFTIDAVALVLNVTNNGNDKYELPKLPYSYDALEPYIDAKTMKIHHTKHHQKYVDDLNKVLEEYPELRKRPVEYLLTHLDDVPEKIRTDVKNYGGGHYNHSIFWKMMSPKGGGEPTGIIKKEIEKNFNSFKEFKDKFNEVAKKVFGSGYAWLCLKKDKKLVIVSSKDQDTPLTNGMVPILGLDVWEHAYYLKYQNCRPDYIDAWWNVINWKQVEENYNNVDILKK